MVALTRRHLLTAGGAGVAGVAATALAACGEEDEPRDEGRDAELLGAGLSAERNLAATYRRAADVVGEPDRRATLREFAAEASAHADELAASLEELGGPGEGEAPIDDEAGGTESVAAASAAISAHREAASLLSTIEGRALAFRLVAADAAQLAALQGLLGIEQVPQAFVTGGESQPFAPEAEPEAGEEDG